MLPISYSNISYSDTEKAQEEHAIKVLLAKPDLTSTLIDQREENIYQQQRQRELGFLRNPHLQTSKQHQLQQNNQQNQRVRYQQVSFEFKLKFFQQQEFFQELEQYQQRQDPTWESLNNRMQLNNLQLRQLRNQIKQFEAIGLKPPHLDNFSYHVDVDVESMTRSR